MFNIILASDSENGIGLNGTIPWNIPHDLELFKSLTVSIYSITKVVIMGYNTMKSLKHGYLKGRLNIVITSKIITDSHTDVTFVHNFQEALTCAYKLVGRDPSRIWVIGGASVYRTAVNHTDLNYIYHSSIIGYHNCDTVFELPECEPISSTPMDCFTFNVLKPVLNCERQYMRLLHDVLQNGESRQTRNGITYSLFGKELVFNVTNTFPLLTTKKMFMRGITEELLFFIRGDTDTKKLMHKGVNIWKDNTSLDFLNKMNLPYDEGVMGPMYGYMWRFFGKPYHSNMSHHSTEAPYVDQLQNIINTLKHDPHSRRLIMTDFNPLMVDMGVLYPCHSLILQFYAHNNMLSVKMYQRSADLFLGLPFNIASTTMLLYIVAKLVNMTPDTVHITLGDCHIYEQHKDAAMEQLSRSPYKLPTLTMPDFKTLNEVENSISSDFVISNYSHHPAIKVDMIA